MSVVVPDVRFGLAELQEMAGHDHGRDAQQRGRHDPCAKCPASNAERVPSTVIKGKVRIPAMPEAACSRCKPTSRPKSTEIPNC